MPPLTVEILVYTAIALALLTGCFGLAQRTWHGGVAGKIAAAFVGYFAVVVGLTTLLSWPAATYYPGSYAIPKSVVAFLLLFFFRKDLAEFRRDLIARCRDFPGDLDIVARVAIAAAVILWGHALVYTFIYPTPGIDAAGYHFPIAIGMVQNHGLEYLQIRNGHANEFPRNGHYLFAEIFLFGGDERHLKPVAFLAGIVAVLAIFDWMRHWRVDRRTAATLAPLFVLMPVVLGQPMFAWGGIDLILHVALVFVLSAIAWLPDDWKGARNRVLWAAVASGLALGTKSQGVLLGGGFLFLGLLHLAITRTGTVRRFAATVAICGVLFLALGSQSYIQNYKWFGNPVSPMQVEVFGKTVFPGMFKSPHDLMGTKHFAGTKDNFRALVRSAIVLFSWQWDEHPRLGGWGVVMLLLIPGMLLGMVILGRRRQWFPIILGFGLFVLMARMPGSWWLRFSMFFPAAAIVYSGVALAAVGCGVRRTVYTSLIVGIGIFGAVDATLAIERPAIIATDGPFRHSLDAIPPDSPFLPSPDDRAMYAWCRDNLPNGSSLVYFHKEWFGIYQYFFQRHDLNNRVFGLEEATSSDNMEFLLERYGATHFIVEGRLPESAWADAFGQRVETFGDYRLYERKRSGAPMIDAPE